ncbi:uncharacterized protein LOC108733229 [Agrilus planipennis]|uniref:Uncharacterized protein LOC108733229 n=1 Tax=Agrilus planipennis TaxID=224129 RepID=A0A7F5RJK8_AGRPL|nr:uncharacterized protein LOC108733229 [Agrilus planipennis]
MSLDRLDVKLPPFVPSDPELWFCMVDRSFEAYGITSESTKFGYVLSNLDPHYAAEVRDIIVNPPATDPYATIRAALIRRLGISQETRMKQLLEPEDLGDKKPTQFLRHLAKTTMSDDLLRTIWSSRLPFNIQAIIATMRHKNLDETAEVADYIMEATQTQSMIAATATPTLQHDTIQQLTNMVHTLQMDLNNMRRHMARKLKNQYRSNSRSSIPRQRSNHNIRANGQISCTQHRRFHACTGK